VVNQETKQYVVSLRFRVNAYNKEQAVEWAAEYHCGGDYSAQVIDQWAEAEEAEVSES